MKITYTLSRYLAIRYVINLLVLLGTLLGLIYLFDVIELLRRSGKADGVSTGLVLEMALLKLPEVGQMLFPFAILFSAIFTFWQLTRRYELIVLRASGFSVWQFLMPVLLCAMATGIILITIINPIGAVLISKFEHLERTYLSRQENQIAVFQEGLWLRQSILIDDGKTAEDGGKSLTPGYVILHAQKIKQPDWVLQNVTALYFTTNNDFFQRVDSKSATLEGGFWIMNDAVIHRSLLEPQRMDIYSLPSNLSVQDIEESFSSPRSMSFWKLPSYIRTLEQTGFDAARLKVYYQNLLSLPVMFMAMILLAATVSLRPPRASGTFLMVCLGVFMGFIIFFLSNYLQALGSSQQIPVFLAAWSPALICLLLGLSVLINLEDG